MEQLFGVQEIVSYLALLTKIARVSASLSLIDQSQLIAKRQLTLLCCRIISHDAQDCYLLLEAYFILTNLAMATAEIDIQTLLSPQKTTQQQQPSLLELVARNSNSLRLEHSKDLRIFNAICHFLHNIAATNTQYAEVVALNTNCLAQIRSVLECHK